MAVAVVIPAYNEAATIAEVVRRACRYADWVIVVDDGSTDGTGEQLADLPIVLLRQPQNRGKAASLWQGMRFALERGAQAVITLDADGQHRPEDIPRLRAAGERYPRRLIIAARLKQRSQAPWLRRLANRTADFWISWAAGYPIRDSQSGFRLYPAELLSRLPAPSLKDRGFVFESEVLIEAARQGYYPLSIPIETLYHPNARASYYRPSLDTLHIARMVAWKLLSKGFYLQGLGKYLGLWLCQKVHTNDNNPTDSTPRR